MHIGHHLKSCLRAKATASHVLITNSLDHLSSIGDPEMLTGMRTHKISTDVGHTLMECTYDESRQRMLARQYWRM
jgi:hypothetical protein